MVLATGGYSNVFYLSTNATGCNATAIWRAHKRGALFANPCYTQIHPTCIPVSGEYQSKLTLMSESLRNDGRIWVPKKKGDSRKAGEIPEAERDYYLEVKYPSFGNLVPRDVASRNAKAVCDEGRGVGPGGLGVYLDFAESIGRLGKKAIAERYGNLFEMYEKITGEDPYSVPMRIYPAVHYTMGGLWVDYHLMSTVPGLFVAGEANFSDHGANRLGASALMQGLADGYFVIPYTVGDYLVKHMGEKLDTASAPVRRRRGRGRLPGEPASRGARQALRRLDPSRARQDHVGELRHGAQRRGPPECAREDSRRCARSSARTSTSSGAGESLNQSLEKAGRVADFLELGELMCKDALERAESCGGHFREESQTPEGEALRDDEKFSYVAAWENLGADKGWALHKEPLAFEHVHLAQRSYK